MKSRRFFFPMLLAIALAFTAKMPNASAQSTETPTDADHQLASRYSALVAELDRKQSPARELIHETSKEQIAGFLSALASTESVNQWVLSRARSWTQRMVPQLEALQQLAPPAPYSVAKRRGKIRIDGTPDEAAWRRAMPMTIQFNRLEKAAPPLATVRLLWDDKFLYTAFTVPDANIIAPAIARDGPVWKSDCIELFLLPDRRFRVYWEIEVSPIGSLYDSLCTKYSDRWGSDMQVGETLRGLQIGCAVHGTPNMAGDRDEGYSIEVAVPFNQLPGFQHGARAGNCIFGLFGRVNRDSAEDDSTLPLAQVPFVGWFHNIWAYQPLVLSSSSRME